MTEALFGFWFVCLFGPFDDFLVAFDRALVQKYLLEKTRICFQAKNERNYHVFYHLLVGSSPQEKQALHLLPPEAYRYLNQVGKDETGLEKIRLE
jgi:myosin heavy subunit